MSRRVRELRQSLAPRPRFGFLDLLVVAVAVYAVWTRTPIGGVGQWTWSTLRGHGAEQPDLIAFFRSEGPPKAWVDVPIALPEPDPRVATGFPEPWRSAVRHGLPAELPGHTRALLGPGDAPPADRLLDWLDANWDGDPESTLTRAALPNALRERAIDRARAGGELHPERFASHRRFLPQADELEAAGLIDSVLALAVVFDLRWPVEQATRISSPFGDRVHPVLRTRKFHNGIDLPVPIGTPILAVQAGRIVAAHEDATSGKYVIVEHDGGVRTAYCHLSVHPEKAVGERVERGERIGESGNTGRSTGPHLHFVLRVDGRPIDPEPYLRTPQG